MRLRVKFTRSGPVKFLGHLDVMRYFQKAIRRSKIDISYSTGFSPHQIMSFAYPLGVGMESEGEYFDIEADSITNSEEMVNALNAQMAEGFTVLDIRKLPDDAINGMASVAAASYEVYLKDDFASEITDSVLSEILEAWNNSQEILFEKEGKKGIITRDILPFVFKLEILPGKNGFAMFLDASSANNVKPSSVIMKLLEFKGLSFEDYKWQILRLDVFTRDSSDKFISLNEVGERF